jgi:hypothetical protein
VISLCRPHIGGQKYGKNRAKLMKNRKRQKTSFLTPFPTWFWPSKFIFQGDSWGFSKKVDFRGCQKRAKSDIFKSRFSCFWARYVGRTGKTRIFLKTLKKAWWKNKKCFSQSPSLARPPKIDFDMPAAQGDL